MKKDQLYIRLGPDATERFIRRFDDREMSAPPFLTPPGTERQAISTATSTGCLILRARKV